MRYDRTSHLFICDSCLQGAENQSDFKHEKDCPYEVSCGECDDTGEVIGTFGESMVVCPACKAGSL